MLRSIIAALLLSGTSIAGNYAYYPNSPLHMGGGYNPYLPDEIYLNCIEHDGEGPVDSDGATSTYVSLEQVKTREDFYRHIDFSASIAGSYKFYKGETSVQMESERAFHSDSFSWIVLFRSNYGRYILKNPRLKPEFSSYSHTELYQACGSEVAIHRNKSVMVYALFTIHNVSASERNRLETHFKGGANGGVWSASVESSYKKIVQEAAANNSVRLSVYALGEQV